MNKDVLRIISAFLITIVFFSNASAQSGSKGKIAGKVVDAQTKAAVDYATISIFKKDAASPFNGGSTDPKGNFQINNIPDGVYKVTVDFIGYQRQTIDNVTVSGGNTVSLGSLSLAPTQNTLKTVTVTAQAPVVENKIDKTVYNAANDVTAQGGVAIDVLKKVP